MQNFTPQQIEDFKRLAIVATTLKENDYFYKKAKRFGKDTAAHLTYQSHCKRHNIKEKPIV